MFICIPPLSPVCYLQNILILFSLTTVLLTFINSYVTVLNFFSIILGVERDWSIIYFALGKIFFSALLWALRNFFTCLFNFVTCLLFFNPKFLSYITRISECSFVNYTKSIFSSFLFDFLAASDIIHLYCHLMPWWYSVFIQYVNLFIYLSSYSLSCTLFIAHYHI